MRCRLPVLDRAYSLGRCVSVVSVVSIVVAGALSATVGLVQPIVNVYERSLKAQSHLDKTKAEIATPDGTVTERPDAGDAQARR